MTTVIFTVADGLVLGFEMSGHTGFDEEGSDIVCSALSSAAIMAANTITEVQRLPAEISESDGFLRLILTRENAQEARTVLDGLLLHITALSQEYSDFITIKISEV